MKKRLLQINYLLKNNLILPLKYLYWGEYFNGRIRVSKTSGRGSIPLLPVSTFLMSNNIFELISLFFFSKVLELKFFTNKCIRGCIPLLLNSFVVVSWEDLLTSYIILFVLFLCIFATAVASDLLSLFVFLELAYSCVIVNLIFQGLCLGVFLHVFAWILLIICVSGLEAALIFILLVVYFGKHGSLMLENFETYTTF